MIATLDFFMLRLAMKIAHWVDYHFHKNNYMLASYAYKFAGICLIGAVGFMFVVPNPIWQKIMAGVVNPLMAWCMIRDAEKMLRASDKWERNPTAIPTEAYGFILLPPGMRLLGLSIGILLLEITIFQDILGHNGPVHGILFAVGDGICWAWNGWLAVAIYFASVPPSSKRRKEKKARDWSFGLTPQPIRSGS